MNNEEIKLYLIIFGMLIIILGAILIFYYVEEKQVKSLGMKRNYEIEYEYQTIIEYPYRYWGI